MIKQIAVVDTGCANLASIVFALERLGVRADITADPNIIENSDRVVLPGVGSASAGIKGVQERDLVQVLQALTQPVLGICLGMQIMAESSEEVNISNGGYPGDASTGEGQRSRRIPCLGIVPGTVSKLKGDAGLVLPHMGWNTIGMARPSRLFEGIEPRARFYFVHSYALSPSDLMIASCNYGQVFCAAIQRDNFYGVQFHPELSGPAGAVLLRNFTEIDL